MVWLKTDGQRGVFVGARRQRFVDEDVPRHVADAIEHREVGDALLLQALHQPVARARGRHADAREAVARSRVRPEPAAQSVERRVVGEIDRERRDRDVAFRDGVKIRAGSRILAGARRPHPVHGTAARIFGA